MSEYRKRPAVRKRQNASHRKWSAKNRDKRRETLRRDRGLHPEKNAARHAVYKAVRSGQLVKQPCRDCGSDDVQAHHPDYSKPLAVVWLCPRCHTNEHQKPGRRP